MSEEPTTEKRKELLEKIKENKSKYLVMNQVPEPTRKRFIDLAEKEHDGNYGFTLKFLMDLYDGICRTNHEELNFAIQDIDGRLGYLERNMDEMKRNAAPKRTLFNRKSERAEENENEQN